MNPALYKMVSTFYDQFKQGILTFLKMNTETGSSKTLYILGSVSKHFA